MSTIISTVAANLFDSPIPLTKLVNSLHLPTKATTLTIKFDSSTTDTCSTFNMDSI